MKKVNTKTKVIALSTAAVMTTAIYLKNENITNAEQYAQITDNAIELNVNKQNKDTIKLYLSNFKDVAKSLQLSFKIEGNASFNKDSINWLVKSASEDLKTDVKLSADKKQMDIFIVSSSNIEVDAGILEICEVNVTKDDANSKEGYTVIPNVSNEGVAYNYVLNDTNKQVKGADIKNPSTDKLTINTAPVISLKELERVVEGKIVLRTGEVFNPLDYVQANDTEDGPITDIKTVSNVDNKRAGTYKVTYTVTDEEGDSTTLEITVLVEDSKQTVSNPVLKVTNKTITIKQGDEFNPLDGVTATDYQGRILQVKVTGDYNVEVLGDHTVTYTVTDSYSNTVTEDVTLKVIKQNAPTITIENEVVEIKQGESFNATAGVKAVDFKGDELPLKVSQDHKVNEVGTYTITYTAEDKYGTISTATRTLKVVKQESPTITIDSNKVFEIKQGEEFVPEEGVKATDFDGKTLDVKVTGDYNVREVGSYEITYTAEDEFGNTTIVTRTLTVLKQESPTITIDPNKVFEIKQGEEFVPEEGVKATDFDGKTLDVKVTGEYNVREVGSYEITYTAEDKFGNTTTEIRTLTVTKQESPVITGVDRLIQIRQGEEFKPEAGVEAVDFAKKKLDVKVTGYYDVTTLGKYVITYTATDEFGNTTTATNTLEVLKQKAPVITVDSKVTEIKQGEKFDPKAGVKATDFDGKTLDVKVTGEYNVREVGTYEITYTATDKYGNTTTATSTLKVTKQESPTITGVNAVVQVRQGDKFDPKEGVKALDFKNKELKVEVTGHYDVTSLGTYTLTYTATDEFGNTTTVTSTLEVIKQKAPIITIANKVVTIKQGENFDPKAGVEAVDFKGDKLEVTVSEDYRVNEVGTYTITYTAVDKYGNITTATITLEVINQDAPVITGANRVIQVRQGDKFEPKDGIEATDFAGNKLDIEVTGEYNVEALGTYTITYTATDKYGNTTTATSTLEVIKQDAPTITGVEKVIQIKQGESFEPIKGVEAVDFEGNKLQVKVTGDYDLTKVGNYEITYTATDKYGNTTTATSALEVINQDAPTITGVEKEITIKQGVNFDPKAGVNAVDFEGKKLEVKVTGDYNVEKVGSYTITYTATDEFGNTTTQVMTLTVVNQDAPTITIDSKKAFEIKQGEEFVPEAGVKALDFKNEELKLVVTGEYDVRRVGSYTITYTATDKYGNTTTEIRTLKVTKQESPTITGVDRLIQIRQGEEFKPEAGVEAVDFEGKKLEVKVTGYYDVSTLGKYTITYTAVDEFGNTTTATNTLEVLKQNAPIITIDNKVIEIKQGDKFDPKAGVKATNFEGKKLDVEVTGEYDVTKVGTYVITYTATDKYGNTTTATRTLKVTKQESPTITGVKELIKIRQGENFDPKAGVEAVDFKNKELKVEVTGHYDVTSVGRYVITYTATDEFGNTTTLTSTLEVVEQEAPIITIQKEKVQIKQGENFDPKAGVEAVDFEGKNLEVEVTGEYDVTKVGSYTITYTATDKYGNTTTATITLEVINQDAPVITGANKVIYVRQGGKFDPKDGVEATDFAGNKLDIEVTGDYNVEALGKYTITYTATDKYGNTTTATSTLEVINQNAPVITGTNKVVQIKQGESFEPIKGVEAVDFEGNKLQVKVTGDYDLTKVGSYEITYTATDKYGNITTATTTLEVINQDAPTITGVEKAITIKQGVNFDPKAGVNAVDFEGKKLEVKVTGDYDLTKVGSYEITYTAIDEFGNTTIEVMTLTVINQDAPTITIDNKVTQIKQGENFDPKAGVTAVDFEGNELEVTVTGEYDVTKVGSYEITYTATDKYGNTTTVTSTLEVVKQESPVITGANKVIQIRQGENFDPKAGVEAVDFEGKKLELIITGDYDVNKLGSYVITYTVTDEFGNTTTATNTLEVVKQDAPVITVDNKVTQIIEGGSFDPKAGVKAVDFEGNELEVTVTGEYDVNKAGTYEITYTATDKYGNTTTATSTLEVIKQETPVENTETVNVDNGEKVVFDKNKPSNIKIVSSKLQNKDVEYILVNGIKVTKTAIEGKLSRSVEEYFTTSDGAITLSAKLFEDLNLDVKENYTIGVGFTDGNEITELVELVMVDNTVTPPGQNNGNNNSNTNGGNNNNTNNGNTNNGNSNSTTNNNNNNSISKIPTTGAAVASSIIAGLGTVIATIGAYIFKKNK